MKTCEKCIYREHIQKNIEVSKNSVIFNEGDSIESLFFIKEGTVKLTKLYKNGVEKVMDVLRDGDFIALLTLLQNKDCYLVTATALEDCVLEVIKREDALVNYETNINFKETCMKCAAHRLENFHNQLYSTSDLDPEEKIMNTLTHLYNKFGYMKNKSHYVKLPISKTDFANMVGLRSETLSRKLSKLQKEGKIDYIQNIYEFKNM